MSAHFRWYPATEETVVPWNARYSFPSQANKCVKITPRIPPKNGANFQPGQVIRLEFPAQGYVNPINTTLEFDVTLSSYGADNLSSIHFQNNIQSTFNRVRLLYGATPLEDLINYNQIVRNLTEWTSTNQSGTMDQVSIAEGIGGVTLGQARQSGGVFQGGAHGYMHVREAYIQGVNGVQNIGNNHSGENFTGGNGLGFVPNLQVNAGAPTTCTRRYQINLALGLLMQDKLLPVKFMASQLAIEITLEQPAACIIAQPGLSTGTAPTYSVNNVNLIPEILEFDASYDAMFLKGLQDGGVPIKFSSWHTFIFTTGGASNVNLLVQERSRSVKALFACQRRSPYTLDTDSGATFFDCAADGANGALPTASNSSSMQNYQWRIGGRYFPAQPVQLSTQIGSKISNGGSEAFVELQKALNTVGDYRLSSSVNTNRWALGATPYSNVADQAGVAGYGSVARYTQLNELDYALNVVGFTPGGNPYYEAIPNQSSFTAGVPSGNCFYGNAGSSCYVSAIDLETSNGIEISGLNAEEQSDIAFIANWSAPQSSILGPASNSQFFNLEVYSYFDAMIILRENNVLELIQ